MSRRRRRIVRDRRPLPYGSAPESTHRRLVDDRPLPLHVDVMVTPDESARSIERERLAWRDIWDETKEPQ